MNRIKNSLFAFMAAGIVLSLVLFSYKNKNEDQPSLKDISYEAFIYSYPLMEQVKTINGMFNFMGLKPNVANMNTKYPMDNVGMPIVAPNLTSMTGGVFIDISNGPVTIEIPTVKDRYVVYQMIDVFTHNFNYLGSRANNGEGGQFVFHNHLQTIPENSTAQPIEMEGDHAIIVIRIDIKNRDELTLIHDIQNQIKVIDAPQKVRDYPIYDKKKAFSPAFIEYVNELLVEIPPTEKELFHRFAKIGIFNDVNLSENELYEVQAGIDSAYQVIQNETQNLTVGNDWFAATTVFGTREYLNGNYLGRATGANFGLWGNSKEEANYFMMKTEGEGTIHFDHDELPPLTDIGFWSLTVHDENVHVHKNEYDSYVLTTDQLVFEEDGSLNIKISSSPQKGNWLYTPGGKMVLLIRAYQADPEKIIDYIPPMFNKDLL
ncbi:DUF1254 domain-containing protein [Flammeovirga agarivorans]|uniref:DUF1254 domain-containing protein n=1 Tax=Flammeovirga agarivorans TaxID=2726742 RepID=A0A7X8XVU5_9BACT|nr:DUF1254 domain-containing protein [Flammeovirga agarivorans]NLR91636.1 DUF1254 domain-containing protein [Flammeovirga agarivorans]